MFDFKAIETGEDFELLCEDLLQAKGLDIQSRPSRGPDGGADIIVRIIDTDDMGFRQESRILIECKHFAQSGRSVRESDVGSIIERTIRHNCNKYLLITSTIPSTSLSQQLQAISSNPSIHISATAWTKNDLQKVLSKFPEVAARHFSKKRTSENIAAPQTPKHIVAIHLHSDFAEEIKQIIDRWNSCQSMYAFVPLRPPRELELRLLQPQPVSCNDVQALAKQINKAAGFGTKDGLVQFCEGRLHEEPEYYQLFSWTTSFGGGWLEQATISLFMKRKLAAAANLESPVFSMILQSMLFAIGCAANLESHDVTRACIMDFNNDMEDILIGLDYGPKFCPHCEKQLKSEGNDYLLSLATAAKEFVHKTKDKGMMPLRMKLREKRQKAFGDAAYDVALSFAGENRDCAERLAIELHSRGIRVFYDGFEKAKLWGEDLFSYLDELYRFRSRLCVIFISRQYSKKLWTNHERKAAQAKAFTENRAYILPIRLDDTEIPGLPPTIGYLNWDEERVEIIAEMIIQKLKNNDK